MSKLDDKYEETLKFSRRSYFYGRIAICFGCWFYLIVIAFILFLVGLWSFDRPITTWFIPIEDPALNLTAIFNP